MSIRLPCGSAPSGAPVKKCKIFSVPAGVTLKTAPSLSGPAADVVPYSVPPTFVTLVSGSSPSETDMSRKLYTTLYVVLGIALRIDALWAATRWTAMLCGMELAGSADEAPPPPHALRPAASRNAKIARDISVAARMEGLLDS